MEDNSKTVEMQVDETTQETKQNATPNAENNVVDNTETVKVDSDEPKNTNDAHTQLDDEANKSEDQDTTYEEATISPEVEEKVEEKENNLEEVGFGGKLVSFLFPIIGVILYFVNKNDHKNPNDYLTWALIGFVIGVIGNLMLLASGM